MVIWLGKVSVVFQDGLNHYLLQNDEYLQVLTLRAAGLRLISSTRLDDWKDIQAVTPAWLILHLKLKVCIISLLKGNNKRCS